MQTGLGLETVEHTLQSVNVITNGNLLQFQKKICLHQVPIGAFATQKLN